MLPFIKDKSQGAYFMKKLLLATLSLVGCAILFVGCASISAQTVATPTTLKIGIEENFASVTFYEKNQPVGFGVDLTKEISRRLEIEPEFVVIDSEDSQQALEDGEIDCILTYPEKSAASDIIASPSYLTSDQVILCLQESQILDLVDLNDRNLGVKEDSAGEYAIEESSMFRSSLNQVISYSDFEDARLALNNGDVDAVVMDLTCAKYYEKMYPDQYSILSKADQNSPEVLATENYSIAFRAEDENLAAQIEKALTTISQDGTLVSFSEKWFEEDLTQME